MSDVYKILRLDSKGRIALGKLAIGVHSFRVRTDKKHRIILEPLVKIPAREKWLFKNRSALTNLERGILDSAKGRVVKRTSFKKYAD